MSVEVGQDLRSGCSTAGRVVIRLTCDIARRGQVISAPDEAAGIPWDVSLRAVYGPGIAIVEVPVLINGQRVPNWGVVGPWKVTR